MLLADDSTSYGVLCCHVVRWRGDIYLEDGLHPNPRGVAEITKNILPTVEQLIERTRVKRAAATKG